MSINRIQKLLFSEYCDFEDMVLVESPFAQTTRDGKGIRQVHLGLTPSKLVLATDVLPPVKESNISYIPGIDPDIETFELVAVYPVECLNLSIFHRRKRQSLKAHFCNNRVLYFELGGFEKRKMFWNLWCERVKYLNPEDPGSSHSETSVATSTSNSTIYLLSSKKIVTKKGIQQLWCNFGVEDVRIPKWSDRCLYMGEQLDEPSSNYAPMMHKPTYADFLLQQQKKVLLEKITRRPSIENPITVEKIESAIQSVNRFGIGIPEGCISGLFLPSDACLIQRPSSSYMPQYNESYMFPIVDYISMTEDSVRIWEASRDNNINVHRRNRHRRRYALAPQPYFLHGLGLWSIAAGERQSVQMKRAVSQVRAEDIYREPELNLSLSKTLLVSSISCEALHLDNRLINHGNAIKTIVKKPVYFWTPGYQYRPRSSFEAYKELVQHLKKIRECCQTRKTMRRRGKKHRSFPMYRRYSRVSGTDETNSDKCNLPNKTSLLSCFNTSKSSPSEKELREKPEDESLRDLRKILRINLALTAWDFDSTTLATQISLIDCTLFLKVTPIELAVLMWQKSSKNAPNIRALEAFAHRISCLVSSEILKDDSDKLRARLISRLINAAEKCHKLSNFQSCNSILCGLQSPAVYRLHKTWTHVRKHHATKYQVFEMLCRLYRDPRLPKYQQAFYHASQENPYLPYLGDIFNKLLDYGANIDKYESWISVSETASSENNVRSRSKSIVKKILSTLRLLPNDSNIIKKDHCLTSYEFYDDKIIRLNRAIEFLSKSQQAAKMYKIQINELAAEYLLKARYRDDVDNFRNSFRIETSVYNRPMWK